MSRIGKLPIPIPEGVEVSLSGDAVQVKGPKGQLERRLPRGAQVTVEDNQVRVQRPDDSRQAKSVQGLTRSLLANMVVGVSQGFEKKLEIVGVGYRAERKDDGLFLTLGYSHPILYPLPPGIDVVVDKQVALTVKGIDKELVGAVAAKIRSFRPPEPYKGKGIRYKDEYIRRKVGKAKA
ncbi:MAG: 50S ribosomal protein L6 [Deltaproteobacteria bacterium]|nr:50S ribosomal protein L6 [Deltaproteobacteria bacterium]MBW2120731.1 50S ribosomal protein L6 [Deltaproteobacteria bacterium]